MTRKAFYLLTIAALLLLAACNNDKHDRYKKADLKVVVKDADKGNPEAQYEMGNRYDEGRDVAIDKKKAFEWYLKAAEQGHRNAQFNVGVCYENGEGVQPDQNMSMRWYAKAAQQGDTEAQKILEDLGADWKK